MTLVLNLLCVIWNGMRGLKKKYVKGVPSRGEGGGVRYLGRRPKYGCFFLNEPSLREGMFSPFLSYDLQFSTFH